MRWHDAAGLILAGVLVSGGGTLEAQRVGTRGAEIGRAELPWLDWPADGAWRRRAQAVRQARWQLIKSGNFGALNARPLLAASRSAGPTGASATVVTGSFFVPVIPIAYQLAPIPFPESDYQDLLFATAPPLGRPYTLKSFYEELSNHRISMSGRIFPTATMDSIGAYYEHGCNGIGVRTSCPDGGQRFGSMLIAALDSISNRPGADTAWNDFDNDGPDGMPNSGDDDGIVDFVTFLHPTVGGECTTTGIWAHRYVISAWNGGSPYVTKTPRRDVNGNPIVGQFIKVNNYTIQSSRGGSNACTAGAIMPVGTVAHETGHAFGLPDLYDTDNNSNTEGIGEWGLMGSGNYTRPLSPASYDAWSLNELGWIIVDTLSSSRTVTTRPRALSDTIFVAKTGDSNELYLLENRQPFESDSAGLGATFGGTAANCRAQCHKQPGLLIWHIDLARIAAGQGTNRVNTGVTQGVALEQADGLNQLRSSSGHNRGDAGDSYPGSTNNTALSILTNPGARTNSGEYTGFIVDQIEQLANGQMKFRFTRRQPSVVSTALVGAVVSVNGNVLSQYREVSPQGDQLTLSVDAVQQTLGGRAQAHFLSWSNGGARAQTLISGAKPDTVVASFTVDNRIQVTATGSGQGTVTASVPGDLVAGFYVPAGTPVTVTATPAQGSIFSGWSSSDTTATSPTLVLGMAHPYDLTPLFVGTVAVDVGDATTEILGTAKLTPQQKTFLDDLGNRNGLYDVGDFLALLRRNGQAASPALLKALVEHAAKRAGKGESK